MSDAVTTPIPSLVRNKSAASAAFKNLNPDELKEFWSRVDAGQDKFHVLNLVKSQRAQNAARASVDEAQATPFETGAVAAGNAATMGGIPTLAAALGHGEGEDFAARKRSNVADVSTMTAQNPLAASVGEGVGLAAPALAGGLRLAPAAAEATAARTVPQLIKAGAIGGAALGAPLGALQTDTGSIPSIAGNAIGGGVMGGLTGGAAAALPAAALNLAPTLGEEVTGQNIGRLIKSIPGDVASGIEDAGISGISALQRAAARVAPAVGKWGGGALGSMAGGGVIPGVGHVGGAVGGAKIGAKIGSALGERLNNAALEPYMGASMPIPSTGEEIGADVMMGGQGGQGMEPPDVTTPNGSPVPEVTPALQKAPVAGPASDVPPTAPAGDPTAGLPPEEVDRLWPRITPDPGATDTPSVHGLTPASRPGTMNDRPMAPAPASTSSPTPPLEPTVPMGDTQIARLANSAAANPPPVIERAPKSGPGPWSDAIDESGDPAFDTQGNELLNPAVREGWREAAARYAAPVEGGPTVDALTKMSPEDARAVLGRGQPTKGGLLGTSQYLPKRNADLGAQARGGSPDVAATAEELLRSSRTAPPQGPQSFESILASMRAMSPEAKAAGLAEVERQDPAIAKAISAMLEDAPQSDLIADPEAPESPKRDLAFEARQKARGAPGAQRAEKLNQASQAAKTAAGYRKLAAEAEDNGGQAGGAETQEWQDLADQKDAEARRLMGEAADAGDIPIPEPKPTKQPRKPRKR